MSIVTLRNAILEARAALTGVTAVTDLVPERNITFGNSPQKDTMPRIVIEVSSAEYDATYTQSRKVQTFTVEYAVYSKSVDTCTAIMDEVRHALDAYTSSAFSVRVTDESFQAELDNVLLGVVVATFQDAAGVPGYDATVGAQLNDALAEVAAWETEFGTDIATYQATPSKIAYPTILHMDDPDDVGVLTWGVNGYQGTLASGALTPGPSPSKIRHVAEVDVVNDPEYLKTLVNNNEFGNKHRFTYDDGTEATEIYSNNESTMTGQNTNAGPLNDGYTGDNPQYIIDHYTGLGWFRQGLWVGDAASGEFYNSRGIYDHYTDFQDWIDKPSTVTLAGFSDWRRPTGPEWTYSLGNVDFSNYMNGNTQTGRDIYFPPLNQYTRAFGGFIALLGPVDVSAESLTAGFNWFVPASQTNGFYLTGLVQSFMESSIANHNNGTVSTLLVRRHYTNS